MREDIIERMKSLNHSMVEDMKRQDSEMAKKKPDEPEPLAEPTDLYQKKTDEAREESKRLRPKGTSKIAAIALNNVVDGNGAEGLAKAYKRAKGDSDVLRARGERERAEIRKRQYMDEYFLPAVEIVVNSCSPDEILNSPRILSTLDNYALLTGSGRGYTASYIKQAYGNQLGQQEGRSEPAVASEVHRINYMLDKGEVRSAVGIATKLKRQIDNGEKMASDADYDLVGRIVAYYA